MNQHRLQRTYTEKELRALIQRATELHENASDGAERNLSLEEIEHIAAELGLPREHLRRAALELQNQPESSKTFSLFGAPFNVDETRVVDGELTEEDWEHIVLELRRFTGRTGRISEVGRAREWTHFVGESEEGISFTRTHVTVRPRDGQTSIEIRKRFAGAAIAAYLATFFFSTFLTFITIEAMDGLGLSFLANAAILGSVVLGALGVVRGTLGAWSRRQKDKLKRLTNRLDQMLARSSAPTLLHEPRNELLELPELDDTEHVPIEIKKRERV